MQKHPLPWAMTAVCCVLLAGLSAAANAAEPLKIGLSMSLTGGLAGGGKSSLLAMQIWKDDVNAKGGLLGQPVELVYYDDQSNSANVPGVYSKLLEIDKVDLVISAYATNQIAPAMPIVMQKNMVFMALFGTVASYPPDTVGMVRAAHEVGLKTKMFGGGMIGLAFAPIKQQLGPLLNGIVAYDVYVPEPTMKFPGIENFLKTYQARAQAEGVDPLGFYLPPFAYAELQILADAITQVGNLDQTKIAEYIHKTTFHTVVGDVKFAENGEWEKSRLIFVQYQGVTGSDVDQFRHPGKAVIVYPPELKSGEFRYPYTEAQK